MSERHRTKNEGKHTSQHRLKARHENNHPLNSAFRIIIIITGLILLIFGIFKAYQGITCFEGSNFIARPHHRFWEGLLIIGFGCFICGAVRIIFPKRIPSSLSITKSEYFPHSLRYQFFNELILLFGEILVLISIFSLVYAVYWYKQKLIVNGLELLDSTGGTPKDWAYYTFMFIALPSSFLGIATLYLFRMNGFRFPSVSYGINWLQHLPPTGQNIFCIFSALLTGPFSVIPLYFIMLERNSTMEKAGESGTPLESQQNFQLTDQADNEQSASAEFFLQKGEYAQALFKFTELGGSSGTFGEAICLYNMDKSEAAQQACLRCLQLDPEHKQAKELLKQLGDQRGVTNQQTSGPFTQYAKWASQLPLLLKHPPGRTATFLVLICIGICVICYAWKTASTDFRWASLTPAERDYYEHQQKVLPNDPSLPWPSTDAPTIGLIGKAISALFALAALAMLICGAIWLIVLAFKQDTLWGIMCVLIFLPNSLLYITMNWQYAKQAFWLIACGFCTGIFCYILLATISIP